MENYSFNPPKTMLRIIKLSSIKDIFFINEKLNNQQSVVFLTFKSIIVFLFLISSLKVFAAGNANVTISSGATANGSFSLSGGTYTFTPSADNAVVNITTLTGYLTGGSNVTILTACSGSGSQSGNVTISGAITAALTAQKTFTITAAGTITVSNAVNLSSTGGVAGGIISFSGATGITTSALISTSGSSPSTGGSGATGGAGGSITLTSSGGAVTVSAGLTAQGAPGGTSGTASGGAGGAISITGTSVTIGTAGSIQTQGGTGPGANGGNGGAVSVTSSSSTISISRGITTTGGNAGSANTGQRGGNAGAVTLTAYTTLSVTGTITATGGSNGGYYYQCGGSGATVTVRGTSVSTSTITTTAGTSGGGASGCGSNGTTSSCTKGNVGAASSTPTVNRNSAMTNITHSTNLITAIGTVSGLPTGVSATYSSNTITISGTPTAVAGTYAYTLNPTTSSSCGIAAGSGTITVVTPVPVELLTFNAILNDNYIEVEWNTSAENNNDFYIIEKSHDGVNWTEVAKIKGAGNSNVKTHYSWLDILMYAGVSYYKLSQVDLDGTRESFDIVSVNNTHYKGLNAAEIYPNPSIDNFNLEYFSEHDDELSIIIESDLGQELYFQKYAVTKGNNIIQIYTESLMPGLYLVLIENNSGSKISKKLVKK